MYASMGKTYLKTNVVRDCDISKNFTQYMKRDPTPVPIF